MSAADQYYEIPTVFQFTTAASTSGDISIPVHQSLIVCVYASTLSGAATARLVFNADTGSNYVTRFLQMASGGTTWVNTANATAAAAIFTPSQALGFLAMFKISNYPTATKAFTFNISYDSGAVATNQAASFGAGEWVNTTAQITQIRMQTSANNFSVNSGFMVWGGDGL